MKNGLILTKAGRIRDALPMSTVEFTTGLKRECFVLWSLPQFRADELTKTPLFPSDADLVESKNSDLHGALLSAHFEAGLWPVVYQGENNGHLIRHVCPMMKAEDKISSQGGKYDFYPHVDNPDLPITGETPFSTLGNCPDTLTLLCLRREDNVRTSLLKLDSVIALLSEETKFILTQPFFKVDRPASFEGNASVEGVPVLVAESGVWYSRFDWHNTSGMNPEAENALKIMRELTLDRSLWFDAPLNPGDAITFLNQRTMHTRNAFQPRFDGTDRWLLRVFGLLNRPLNSQLLDAANCLHHLRTI
ncbi:hypothetical protein J3D56_001856 [Erwinia persicina]|uniref:TauD/TfdA family dioxygenase n=1 Tax=Erwinia persicina TaxID=55211 RepID=UPI00209D04BE|nr:TauD/TfdA family dioxygenase [Erwinia persicina]MCP1438420.1 hypothetical protein [Erwinia persicina]